MIIPATSMDRFLNCPIGKELARSATELLKHPDRICDRRIREPLACEEIGRLVPVVYQRISLIFFANAWPNTRHNAS